MAQVFGPDLGVLCMRRSGRDCDPMCLGNYSLMAFVSHMGANTTCGHYVCHVFKEGRWVIYNDSKVAISEKPPLELGYIYVYRRNDVHDEQ